MGVFLLFCLAAYVVSEDVGKEEKTPGFRKKVLGEVTTTAARLDILIPIQALVSAGWEWYDHIVSTKARILKWDDVISSWKNQMKSNRSVVFF